MSARSSFFPKAQPSPDVLGDLLHSLSQPLTSLRCFLELSLIINEISGTHLAGIVDRAPAGEMPSGQPARRRRYGWSARNFIDDQGEFKKAAQTCKRLT